MQQKIKELMPQLKKHETQKHEIVPEKTKMTLNLPTARFNGKYFIHWDKNRFFEGDYTDNIHSRFRAFDGGERNVTSKDVYQMGIPAGIGDKCIAYWTRTHKYANPGRVTDTRGNEQELFVKFDDGGEGWMPAYWVHKMQNVD